MRRKPINYVLIFCLSPRVSMAGGIFFGAGVWPSVSLRIATERGRPAPLFFNGHNADA